MKNSFTALMVLLAGMCGGLAEKPKSTQRSDQKGWLVESDQVTLFVTRQGGHMAPVTFFRGSDFPVAPYYISPWQGEEHDYPVPVLVPLRGDFFCMPFGGNGDAFNGEQHPPHGETAGSRWDLEGMERENGVTTLSLQLETEVRPGTVSKKLHLKEGQNVIYTTHHITGFQGRTSLGHHATLAMPEEEGAFRISHSPIRFGYTNPTQFSVPANAEYQQLGIRKRFQSLSSVPSIFEGAPPVDCSRLPQKKGYADLLQIFPKDTAGKPAWLAAVRADQGWLWFSMKDPKVLTSTVMWIENGGRHGLPWFGRNNCVGLEDVTAYFADGLKPSASDNLLTGEGVKTSLDLTGDLSVHYIQGVVKIPEGFDEVSDVVFGKGEATFVAKSGTRVTVPVNHGFLSTGKL